MCVGGSDLGEGGDDDESKDVVEDDEDEGDEESREWIFRYQLHIHSCT